METAIKTAELDAFRGRRNYLRGSDVLALAPLSLGPRSFEFRFRKPACHPGRWVRADSSLQIGSPIESVATLRLRFSTGTQEWLFAIDRSRAILKRIEDVDEADMCATLKIDAERSLIVMAERFSLWDYIVASARKFRPSSSWHFAYLNADYEVCAGAREGRRLRLELTRERSKFVEFRFFVEDAFGGVFGACRRD